MPPTIGILASGDGWHVRALTSAFERLGCSAVRLDVSRLAGRIAARVQESGECWFGPTIWRGRPAIRISVSSHATTTDDVRRSLEAIAAATEAEQLKP